jgi:hypothetical protein
LVEILESRLLDKLLGTKERRDRLAALAAEVAQRKKDPYAAVAEILNDAGMN